MGIRYLIGVVVALVLSTWASFSFFRGSITGAPPLYSHGRFQQLRLALCVLVGNMSTGVLIRLTDSPDALNSDSSQATIFCFRKPRK
jgi:hypothetical protein